MRFNKKIYDYGWQRLANWMVPIPMRKGVFRQLYESVVVALKMVHQWFMIFKRATEYKLTITPQVVYLERMLNDRFDVEDRRIYILEEPLIETCELYLTIEAKPRILPKIAEGGSTVVLYTKTEPIFGNGDFTIKVPASLEYEADEMHAMTDQYKLPHSKYTIETI